MKSPHFFFTAISLLTFLCRPVTGQAQLLPYESIGEKAEALIQQYIDLDLFSGVVLIAHGSEPFYRGAYGLADRETERANTLETLFDIGSMNKTFTTIAIHRLVDEGKLALDDHLTDYVSGFRDPRVAEVTIRQLLHHESGFTEYHSPDFFDAPSEEKTLAAIVDRIRQLPLAFDPGTGQEYSNAGYVLLGAVIEAVSGQRYADYIQATIVDPMELEHTYVQDLERVRDRQAIGYFRNSLGELFDNQYFTDEPNPDGGFLSTAADILRFYRAYFYGNQLRSAASKKGDPFFEFLEPLKDEPGRATGMAGGFEGANTALFFVPSMDVAIVVFANMDEPVAENIASGILAIIKGETPEPPARPAVQNAYQAYAEHGVDYLREHFDELTTNFHPDDPRDFILNMVGYDLLFADRIDDAIAIFQLNTELFPDVANTYDSLAEAWLKKGDRAKALALYRQALEINPDLPSARQMVDELEKK
ncbi:MAG: serine hydrolase [Lewinella sp.]|nr:serine hydrolase [Lewinella sp.]